MAYEKYTILQFQKAWFEEDYSDITKEEFGIVYSEYIDTSGLFMSEDFERQSYIHHLNSRINYVKMFIRLQREFISEFNIPFIRDFEKFKNKYGYNLKWKNDLDDFENQLSRIESREQKNISFLEDKIKELNNFRKENHGGNEVLTDEEKNVRLQKSRKSFIKMINSLGKLGYSIDKKETTVEELSLMIKQQLEESETYK